MVQVRITREARVPDPLRLRRHERSPELGPRVLFFSGGSALRGLSQRIIRYTHNSIHLITPFDSGGSSATLRQAFGMPAIGDIRNRLMALSDQSLRGNPEVVALFAHRFAKDAPARELREAMQTMARGRHPLVSAIPDPMRKIVRHHLRVFTEWMPPAFDLTGASIGNLVLTAGYLEHRRHLDPVIYIFSKLAEVRGTVRPVVNRSLHLCAELDDGTTVLGQHLITGKQTAPLASPVRTLRLVRSAADTEAVRVPIRDKVRQLIASAELICFPVGSFWTSLVATLLPQGVGAAVAANPCPKVFIPNLGHDPEAPGLTVADQLRVLLTTLTRDAPGAGLPVNFVLVDQKNGKYPGPLDKRAIQAKGAEIIDCPLVTPDSAPLLDPELLARALLSLT
ncbi:GAK system CofD-like protein [Desulfocurvus vexinensis]|uniref:GAK system CofD-like protein n=1 Tax=Desulfocurvus vexinensis TaxID=399548 RepID=UPI00048C660A|nr:GAK system CofD-like protein [Desulfocurvus vexinensis]